MEHHLQPDVLRPPVRRHVAQLLESTAPARVAWVADGEPRVAPMWFHWTGAELALVAFAGAAKLRHLRTGSVLAVTIDSDDYPYRSLGLRGPIEVRPVEGLAEEYRLAARRHLGPTTAERWLRHLGPLDQVVLTLRPTVATTSDLATESSFVLAGPVG